MTSRPAPTLAEHTTLRVGGPARRWVEAESETALVIAVRDADSAGEPVLVLGAGSNLLVADAGFPGVVVRDVRTQITVPDHSACAGVTLNATAGTPWEAVVERAVGEGWAGVEALTGIPGTVGATPVQNVGAYGQEVAQTISAIRTWDRWEGRIRTISVGDLGFGYRTSLLKRSLREADGTLTRFAPTPRFVVLDVTFELRPGTLSAPVAYGELARTLGVEIGERAPLAQVRDAVRALRAGKGMLLDGDPGGADRSGAHPAADRGRSAAPVRGAASAPVDHDRWSAGSFFTNPIVPADVAADLPEAAPRFAAGEGLVKTSAAWLIEQAGFGRGHGLPGPAALSTKHALALTNRGGATAQDLLALAREVRDGVRERFGVVLVPEPVLVGVEL